MSTPDKPKGDDVEKKVQEAGKLRATLEKLAESGQYDLKNAEHRAMHERLDALEAWIYRARKA